MSQSMISWAPFQSEEAAYAHIESCLWPKGPVCPHCGSIERIKPLKGKTTRIGLYKCYVCYKPFTVKIGTIFEDSHIPLNKWLQAIYMIASSKKGISCQSASQNFGRYPQERLVPGTSYPRGNEKW